MAFMQQSGLHTDGLHCQSDCYAIFKHKCKRLNNGWVRRHVDPFGTITSLEITNHGYGYTAKPSIVTTGSNCLCGGQPGTLPGAFEQCLKLKVGPTSYAENVSQHLSLHFVVMSRWEEEPPS